MARMLLWKSLLVLVSLAVVHGQDNPEEKIPDDGILVITVATEETDGFKRFMMSANKHKLNVKVLGLGQKWKGGDVVRYAGGGHKINLLKNAMEKYKDKDNLLIMFVDSYDLILAAKEYDIMKSFKKFDARVVFSAEGFCWPDPSLSEKYPVVTMNEKRYLNSGGFIGYAPEIYSIVTSKEVEDLDDDQLFYTQVFLDEARREKLSLKLDTRGEIFQNLNGALDEVKLNFKGSSSYLYNVKTGTSPHVIHGNGPIKVEFNNIANYLNDRWTPTNGCQACQEDTISLKDVPREDFPSVTMAIHLEKQTYFVEDFFERLGNLDYPKKKMDVFLHYVDEKHTVDVQKFVNQHGKKYNSIKVIGPSQSVHEWEARSRAMDACIAAGCQYFLSVNADVQVENAATLQLLIETNRSVVAPLMVRPGRMWSNFWGELSHDGFYKRSDDYPDIIQWKKVGQWNVPYISDMYLIHGHRLSSLRGSYINGDMDADMALCSNLREKGIFMYVDNQHYYGHLVSSDNFDGSHLHNDLYALFDNKYTWEKKYLHENYTLHMSPGYVNLQPCPDVYWMPIVSAKFCQDYIEEMENFGDWSGGTNKDTRLAGGYENVPTVDIHTNQIGWETHWLQFLKDYIAPMSSKLFQGYFSDARAVMNFVVRYKPGEQDHLRPHHDSSTYTINIALNTPGVDYEGGGVNFLRYNCTVTGLRRGWLLMHPGRLTHFHEGLKTTKGTRYIMVCFVDP